jgi:Antibiotic biosynthesis monooxygenase
MALGFYFRPSGFTKDKYEETLKQLEAAGAGAPAGRSYHVALEADGEIQVFDVWESQAAFDAFGATLVPIMAGVGVDPGEPMVAEVHNVIVG